LLFFPTNNYSQQSKQLLSSVIDYGQKEGIPKLAGKATYAATSFGLDWFITGKSMRLLNKFAKIIRSEKMGQFLQKAPKLENATKILFNIIV
jgi:hypothetical protein